MIFPFGENKQSISQNPNFMIRMIFKGGSFLFIFATDLMVGFISIIKLKKGKVTSVFMIGFVFRGL